MSPGSPAPGASCSPALITGRLPRRGSVTVAGAERARRPAEGRARGRDGVDLGRTGAVRHVQQHEPALEPDHGRSAPAHPRRAGRCPVRASRGPRLDRQAGHRHPRSGRPDHQPVGRQPAEGARRPRVASRPAGARAGRSDGRHRRRCSRAGARHHRAAHHGVDVGVAGVDRQRRARPPVRPSARDGPRRRGAPNCAAASTSPPRTSTTRKWRGQPHEPMHASRSTSGDLR